MFTCHICNETRESIFKLSKHITNTHKIKIKDYYDSYLAEEKDGKCIYCNNQTYFQSITDGYNKSCKHCKSAAAKDMRKKLKEDPLKFNEFRNKVSNNQKDIWQERKENGKADIIHQKSSKTNKLLNAQLTVQERKERFGWQNKLTPKEFADWKQQVMVNTGCHKWWKNATNEEKANIVKKRISTIIQTEIELVESSINNPTDWSKYYSAVNYITEMNYQRYKKIIDPNNLRGKDYHLDHKFSIKAGFINKISPKYIGHRCNLELLPALDNMKKNAKCSITIETLLESINDKI